MDGITIRGDISPVLGGCWYCYAEDGSLDYSAQFDTFVHLGCLISRMLAAPDDPEAGLMAKELLEFSAPTGMAQDWCRERYCPSFYIDFNTGKAYPCPHREDRP